MSNWTGRHARWLALVLSFATGGPATTRGKTVPVRKSFRAGGLLALVLAAQSACRHSVALGRGFGRGEGISFVACRAM